jgi:putative membrane protein
MNGLYLALKGAAMGIAEVIPGVSGGTIAFVTGIYQTLLASIKAILSPNVWPLLFKGKFREFWNQIHGSFLSTLIIGMFSGLVVGIFATSFLLAKYPVIIWAFFFGLILSSSFYVGRQLDKWNLLKGIMFVSGILIAYGITTINPGAGSTSLIFVFIAGMIAISALILPGISGSFILLLMGMYSIVLNAAKSALTTLNTNDILMLATFATGCIVGLALFSRVLTYAFSNFKDWTLAVLTGFMMGSLPKIWPWRMVVEYRTNSKGLEVPFIEKPVGPFQFDGEPMLLAAFVACAFGILLVFFFGKMEKNSSAV